MRSITVIAWALLGGSSFAAAATNDLSTALQRGLFEEEANHNLDAAIQAYQSVINQYDKDRKLVATAIFRLGETYRKQGNTNEATGQYERVVREFSDQAEVLTASRQNLVMLGYTPKASSPAPLSQAARQEQRRLYEEEIKLAEKQLGEAQKRVDTGGIAPGELIPLQRDVLRLKRQLAALDLGPESTTEAFAAPGSSTEAAEVKRIQAMIKDSPDLVNAMGGDASGAPLHQAAAKGELTVARFLLANGADIEVKNLRYMDRTALHMAAESGHRAIVELLLDKGANVNCVDSQGFTPLHLAVGRGFRNVAEVLLAHKGDPNAKTGSRTTPLHLAVAEGLKPIAELLLGHGADVNAVSTDIRSLSAAQLFTGTPLHIAAERGDQTLAQLLLEKHADVNAVDSIGATPLHRAAANGQFEVAKLLLAHGAQVNAQDRHSAGHGWTPLHEALNRNKREIITLLLNNKADPNSRFDTEVRGASPNSFGHTPLAGYTPLLFATYNGDAQLTAQLLNFHADPNLRSDDGTTVMFNALKANSPTRQRILTELLEHGADVNARYSSQSRLTTLLRAVEGQDKDSVQVLLAHKADVNAQVENGWSPLHYAAALASNGHDMTEIATLLLDAGADVNLQNNEGQTPLSMLSQASNPTEVKLANLLRQHGSLEEVPRPSVIQVTRQSAGFRDAPLSKGSNDWNHFTILEALAIESGVLTKHPEGEAPLVLSQNEWVKHMLPFPDLQSVQIKRPSSDLKSWREQNVDLTLVINSGECSKDVAVQWGDIIQIPEADHPLNEPWPGFPKEQWENIMKCLSRTVEVIVKGRMTKINLKLDIKFENTSQGSSVLLADGQLLPAPVITSHVPFWIKPALRNSGVLLASSDLSRVKVTRRDPATGKKREWILDCSDSKPAPDFWLRDGDVIEVPDKT